MTIRTDFVTNSSSSSFVLDIIVETEDERWHPLYRHFKLQGDYLDAFYSYDIDENGEIIESDENPSEDGSYDGAIDFYFQILKEISRGKTYYRGKKVNSIIKRTVVEGFNEGGADEINKIAVTYDSKITLPTPTKEGYKFIGWYLNDELFTDELYAIADNIKLIAKWE